ncbi:MAG TPA: hypothetical protein VF008_00150 [Niastella sp.]
MDCGNTLKDTDGDGMPDAWEKAKGLNESKDDAGEHWLSKQYTNLEVYINGLCD